MTIDKNSEDDKYASYSIKELFTEYRSGNIEARDEILKRYKHYVYDIVEEYKGLGLEDEDLLQSGYEGLIYAIENCAKNKLDTFPNIFQRHVHKTIIAAIIDNLGMNYLDVAKKSIFKIIKLIKDINELERIYSQACGRKPTLEEIKEALINDEITAEDIEAALLNLGLISSVDSRLHEFNNGYRVTSVTRPTEDEVIIKELQNLLYKLEMPRLITSRNIELLRKKYILGETCREIGIDLRITRGAVSVLESKILFQIHLRANYLKGYLEEIYDYNTSKDSTYSLKPKSKSN